ncbi:unnamed protein product [Rotaria sp. Silwood1]|nr:unnamed protein product [Rotaria sp. Silwood1]
MNGLVLLAEEEVDKVISAHYEAKLGCATRILHQHLSKINFIIVKLLPARFSLLDKIYNKISEARIAKVTKANSAHGHMHPSFSNKGPRKVIQARQVFERLQVDLVDLSRRPVLKNGTEFRYALVIVDIFSRYLLLRPLKTEVSDHLELIFREHGTPSIIQTDQGTEFQGVFDDLCNKRNIRHIRSRAYHPESQGKIERLNRSWKNKMFFDVIINGNNDWVANLSSYSEIYNQSKHRGLGNLTPFFVYFGREAVLASSSNILMDESNIEQTYVELNDEEPLSPTILTNEIKAKEKAKQKANAQIQNYYDKQKSIYKKNACAISYNVGDPETSDELETRQQREISKKCVSCDPAVPSNGGAVTEGNLTFVFTSTCTLDYFLSFMRLAFLHNDCFRNFLQSVAQQQNIVAQTLLKMEPSLYALDWNMARLIWAKMIGIVDRALNEQHRSEATFSIFKVFSHYFNVFLTF